VPLTEPFTVWKPARHSSVGGPCGLIQLPGYESFSGFAVDSSVVWVFGGSAAGGRRSGSMYTLRIWFPFHCSRYSGRWASCGVWKCCNWPVAMGCSAELIIQCGQAKPSRLTLNNTIAEDWTANLGLGQKAVKVSFSSGIYNFSHNAAADVWKLSARRFIVNISANEGTKPVYWRVARLGQQKNKTLTTKVKCEMLPARS